MGKWPEPALDANDTACELIDARKFVEAIPHAETAARLAPGWVSPHFNLAVAYKHARRWGDVLAAADRIAAIDPSAPDSGLHWNVGVAATALGDWPRARAAWAAAGIAIPPGDGPIEMALGWTPVRVSVDEHPEVVWCERIDPVRARITSVPLPESDRRYGDLVLHDGEPRGKRTLHGHERSVFDELELLAMSPYATFRVIVHAGDADALGAITEGLDAHDVRIEDWTDTLEMLCKECSLGNPDHHDHDHAPSGEWRDERRLGIAARAEADLAVLRGRRGVRSIEQVLAGRAAKGDLA